MLTIIPPLAHGLKCSAIVLLLILCPTVGAKDLVVGVGNFEPFFIKEGNKGLFLDLTKEIFKLLPQHTVKYTFMPNRRLAAQVANGKIDVACNIFKDSHVKAHLSVPLFRFTDVVVSNKHRNLSIEKVADLKGLRVAAYQGAKELLGGEFKTLMTNNPHYKEQPDQSRTILMVLHDRADVRVGDIFIFLNDLKNLAGQQVTASLDNFTIHRIWPDVYSHMAFKDSALRDDVNNAIKIIKGNGTFDAVYKRYEAHLVTDNP